MTPAATAICPPQTPYAPPFQPEIARSHRPLRPPACETAGTMLMGGGQLVQDERRQGGNEQTVEVISCPSDLRAGIRRSDRCWITASFGHSLLSLASVQLAGASFLESTELSTTTLPAMRTLQPL